MKWLLPFLLLLVGCPSKTPTPPPPPSFSWTGTGNPSIPACSATTGTNCLLSYTLTDVTNPANPVIIANNLSILTYSYVMSTLPTAGIHVYDLVTVGKDAVGNSVTSGPASTTLTITN